MEPIAIRTESAHLTEEQFFMLCSDNKELRFERDKNKNIIVMPLNGGTTSIFQAKVLFFLYKWNKKYKLGCGLGSSTGFILPNGAMRAPDGAWIAKERWEKLPQKEKERFGHICPDFVIEVRSKTDTLKQQQEKMEEWIENGCRLGWLIDMENKTAYIYKPKREVKKQSFKSALSGEEVLKGFELNLSEI